MMTLHKKMLRKIVVFLVLFCVIVLSLFPLRLLYVFSTACSHCFVKFTQRRFNQRIARNQQRCFPDRSHAELKHLHYLAVRTKIDFMAEFIKMPYRSKKSIKRRCVFTNLEVMDEAFKEHKFVICYCGHLVNYETLVSFPLHNVDYGMCHLYLAKNSRQSVLLRIVLWSRSRFGAINIPTYSPLRTLVQLRDELDSGKSAKKGYVFGTLADMDDRGDMPHYAAFFGYPFAVKTGSERIGRKMDMAFVFAQITMPKRGFYEITFKKMEPKDKDTNPHAYTDEFVRLLEQNIKLQPELWLQWDTPRF